MKGLIIKDLKNLRKYSRTVFIMLIFFVVFAFTTKDTSFIKGMIVLMLSFMSITSFSYDKQTKWDAFALALPISRKTMVLSKYTLAFLLALAGMLLSGFIGIADHLLTQSQTITETLVQSYALFAIAIVYLSILMPLVYKFGAEKSRILMIAVFAIPALIIGLGSQSGSLPDEQVIMQLIRYSPLVLIVCFSLSFVISNAIYQHKEV